MNITLHPRTYAGIVKVPASKSYLQRAIAVAALAKGTSTIEGYTESKDALAALRIIQALGATSTLTNDTLTVQGIERFNKEIYLQCGEAGLSARMFSPIAGLSGQKVVVSGEGSLLLRPMHMIEDALTQCGLSVTSQDGKLPLTISGKIQPSELTVDGSESSQLLTGLLIALSAVDGTSTIHVHRLKSVPYINMTLDLMKQLGLHVQHDAHRDFTIHGTGEIKAFDYVVEGDWSGAAFHVVAAAIAGQVRLTNINVHSAQADLAILEIIQQCGAEVHLEEQDVLIKKKALNAFEVDITDCPDLFPILAVLAVCCQGTSKITGIHRLKSKESDRLTCMQEEFATLGITTKVVNDTIFIAGQEIKGGKVKAHNDHRIAMALAVLALRSNEPIEIEGIEAADKSYPQFFNDYLQLINKN